MKNVKTNRSTDNGIIDKDQPEEQREAFMKHVFLFYQNVVRDIKQGGNFVITDFARNSSQISLRSGLTVFNKEKYTLKNVV